jgi:LytTr DNA-binding domain
MVVTTGGEAMTNGGASSTRLVAIVSFVTLTTAVVNALSRLDEMRRANLPVDAWEPWVWELSSAVFWIAVAAPLVMISRRLRPPTLPWVATIAALIILSIPVCALHLVWFAASRGLIYSAVGSHYVFDGQILYEWRKDVLSVLVIAAIAYALDHWTVARAAVSFKPDAPGMFRLEIRDGSRRHWLAPKDIERVESAGNYVELFTPEGTLLHRATLAAIEADLAVEGFVRIHRSRLVRRDAVVAIETTTAGDFSATLTSGAVVAGSRRFRSVLLNQG